MSYLNILSLIMGLLAWGLPIRILLMRNVKRSLYGGLSLVACMIALYAQILYTNHLIQINDTIALLDTNDAVVFASRILIIGTIALNVLPFIKDRLTKYA